MLKYSNMAHSFPGYALCLQEAASLGPPDCLDSIPEEVMGFPESASVRASMLVALTDIWGNFVAPLIESLDAEQYVEMRRSICATTPGPLREDLRATIEALRGVAVALVDWSLNSDDGAVAVSPAPLSRSPFGSPRKTIRKKKTSSKSSQSKSKGKQKQTIVRLERLSTRRVTPSQTILPATANVPWAEQPSTTVHCTRIS